jgi:hypothetical protein
MAITCWLIMLLNDSYYDYYKLIFKDKQLLDTIDFYIRIFFNCFNTFLIVVLFVLNRQMFLKDP